MTTTPVDSYYSHPARESDLVDITVTITAPLGSTISPETAAEAVPDWVVVTGTTARSERRIVVGGIVDLGGDLRGLADIGWATAGNLPGGVSALAETCPF